jgi:hypothetical protein
VASAGQLAESRDSPRFLLSRALLRDDFWFEPYDSESGNHYRKDLLDKYGLKPPSTWGEMTAACQKIKAGENDRKLSCYAGQFQKYEGLTVTSPKPSIAPAVRSPTRMASRT